MKPADLPLAQTYAFVASRVMGLRRILEVGCGDGRLARHVAATGVHVTALDLRLPDDPPLADRLVFVQEDFLRHEAEPYDAVVFTSSLHHISPLGEAIARAKTLLRPGGFLLAEEFDVAAPDEKTATWFYGIQQLLAAQNVYPAHAIGGAPGDAPLERWRAEHAHEPPLHDGASMRAAVEKEIGPTRVGIGPYLYRYMCANLPATSNAGKFASRMFETEKQRIGEGTMTPVGLRLVARRV